VFVSIKHASLAELPRRARVGTSSQRRRAQLKALRSDIEAVEFRGNVDTRLRKLSEGQVDAILLAAAGLDRLGKTDWVRERLDPQDFCPAAGQGSLAIEIRSGDVETLAAVAFLDHADTRFAVTAERAALAALGGGCQVPIGIHCRPSFSESASSGSWVEIFGVVASPDSGQIVRVHLHAPLQNTDPVSLGHEAAEMLLAQGAASLLAAGSNAPGGAA
jgi:hydroxymethylbilane synthase